VTSGDKIKLPVSLTNETDEAIDADLTANFGSAFKLAVDPAGRSESGPLHHRDDRLIRHRWAVSWTGARWIAIDAAFGAAPAGGNLIGLAVHDAVDAGLVAGEAALTQVRAARWADSQ
jgi:hypothetical protein